MSTVSPAIAGASAAVAPSANSEAHNTSVQVHPNDLIYIYHWRVDSVGPQFDAVGYWVNCVSVTKLPYAYTAICSLATTVSNNVTGNVTVSAGAISAAVGFSVGTSRTITAGAAFTIPANHGGYIQWRGTYHSKMVFEGYYRCLANGASCLRLQTATAQADQFQVPGFQYNALA